MAAEAVAVAEVKKTRPSRGQLRTIKNMMGWDLYACAFHKDKNPDGPLTYDTAKDILDQMRDYMNRKTDEKPDFEQFVDYGGKKVDPEDDSRPKVDYQATIDRAENVATETLKAFRSGRDTYNVLDGDVIVTFDGRNGVGRILGNSDKLKSENVYRGVDDETHVVAAETMEENVVWATAFADSLTKQGYESGVNVLNLHTNYTVEEAE